MRSFDKLRMTVLERTHDFGAVLADCWMLRVGAEVAIFPAAAAFFAVRRFQPNVHAAVIADALAAGLGVHGDREWLMGNNRFDPGQKCFRELT